MSYEQALQRLLEEARARRREFARQRRLSGDIVDLLKQAGVFRALVARRFGGDEQSPSDFCRLVERISAADGSTGWIASFGHAAIYLSALPVETLETIYADGPDVIFAGGIFPPKPAWRVEGGFLVNGRWGWASGCTAAAWLGVGIKVDDGGAQSGLPRLAVVPRKSATIIENWDVNGLGGTGSHDIEVTNTVVPESWTFSAAAAPRSTRHCSVIPRSRSPRRYWRRWRWVWRAGRSTRRSPWPANEPRSPVPRGWPTAPMCRSSWPRPRLNCARRAPFFTRRSTKPMSSWPRVASSGCRRARF
jgi:hypothetical protein